MAKSAEEREAERKAYEVERALKVLAKWGHPAAGAGDDYERIKEEHEQYQAALLELTDERDQLTEALSQDRQAGELARLQQGLRDRDWRDAWRDVARESGMIPKAIDHAFRHSGLSADQDEPDRRAIQAAVARLREDSPFFWPSQSEPAPAAGENTPAVTVPSGNGTGFVFDRGSWKAS